MTAHILLTREPGKPFAPVELPVNLRLVELMEQLTAYLPKERWRTDLQVWFLHLGFGSDITEHAIYMYCLSLNHWPREFDDLAPDYATFDPEALADEAADRAYENRVTEDLHNG